ncbi:ZIP zinc transporter-domain-containing protein [Dunaliella salina]|uniref:ZIP zinc transporter-domain-containing protein n=1 Tax=Dunaliella salina TaxID=3046 RepID=A0ABQ7GEH3_DUNSA|nr:ZIP zinc transporter-domain-containing protein [Dunaliella salina]|eukprot:KAF5833001.1 ZIP zinc transporter-domain-containing protein [Dunaliella salina]
MRLLQHLLHRGMMEVDDDGVRQQSTLDLRVISIPAILGAGLLGALSPLYLQAWQSPNNLLQRMTRSFSGGAILALAIIHVMPDAYEALEESMQEAGQLVGGSVVLLGIFAMVFIESMANQMLCPSKHASVHIHGCNQYHANNRARRATSEDGGPDSVATPLLPAAAGAVLVDLVHQNVHGDEQEQGEEEGEGMQHSGRYCAPTPCDGRLGGAAHADAPASDDDENKVVQANGLCHLQPTKHVLRAHSHSYPGKLAPGLHHHAHSHSHPSHLEHPHLHEALHKRGHAHALRGGHEAVHMHSHDLHSSDSAHSSHPHHQRGGQSVRKKVMAYMLELGCVFHSLFIGLSLGVTIVCVCQVLALIVALAVHQLLEGLALGSVVAAADFGRNSGVSMAVMYSLTTPLGVGLGIMASYYYGAVTRTGLVVQGLANAASAGMLLYIALVQLVAEHNKYVAAQYASSGTTAAISASGQTSSSQPLGPNSSSSSGALLLRHKLICAMPGTILLSHIALVAGAGLMWVLAFWA